MANFPQTALRSRLALIALCALAAASCSGPRPAPPHATGAFFTVPVFPGDTLPMIAERYDVRLDDLVAINRIKNPARRLTSGLIRVPVSAQSVETPVGLALQAAPPPPPAPFQPHSVFIESHALAPLPSTAAQTTVPAQPTTAAAAPARAASEPHWYDWIVSSAPAPEPEQPTESGRRFVWPVQGRILSSFGERPGGGRNDGINILTQRGAPILAAGSGEVTYVGNELKGYGNLILIKHEGGFITAYAHADNVEVRRGERVERGDIIGAVGTTGDVTQPQLHFELRLGTRPLDPTLYLASPRARSRELLAESAR